MELYLYDFSELDGEDVKDGGRYGYAPLDYYWEESGRFAFLVRGDGRLAGFALLRRGTCFPERDVLSDDSGMMITEFIVMRKYRHQGIGKQVARELFEHYPGRWEVAELPQNAAGLAFWRKTIGEYTRGDYEEVLLDNERWHGPVQVFDNN